LKRLVVLALALGLFALLAYGVVTRSPLIEVDRQILLFMVAHRADWLTSLAKAVSAAHQTVVVLAATALAAAILAWRRHARWALLLLAVPTGMLANDGLKHVFGRSRPALEDPLVRLQTLSFPSGHAIAGTLFYGALCLVVVAHVRQLPLRMAAVTFALAMIALVAASRVYLGVHYLSDVLAGISFGVAWLALALEALARWEARRPR
jgi:membrane-associated phospholipid phosphatase